MKLSILYNWPIGKKSAQVSIEGSNIEDFNFRFRLNILDKPESHEWVSSGWVNHNEVDKLKICVHHEALIQLDKKNIKTGVEGRIEIDCAKEWPADAYGGTSVDTGSWV